VTVVGVVGAGRAGLGLALALSDAGHTVRLHGRRGKQVPPPLSLSWGGPPPWVDQVEVVLLAVRDGAVAEAAAELMTTDRLTEHHVVMHLSGLLDEAPLAVLRPTGAALGSLHPLQAIARPEVARTRLRGALAAVTGDERACAVGAELARTLGMRPVQLSGGAKPRYHAAAVIASNYLVVLAAAAERLMAEAGVDAEAARQGIATLVEGTVANIRDAGAAALTGPIARGDVETVRAHVAVLPDDVAVLYRALGRATLAQATLDETARAQLQAVLAEPAA
jgi:predicted short-subunit dehydrogenase-like oxidoreductase (DUF2520 family)